MRWTETEQLIVQAGGPRVVKVGNGWLVCMMYFVFRTLLRGTMG